MTATDALLVAGLVIAYFNSNSYTMNNLFNPEKKVTLTLVGLDGNAFSLMGAFRSQAREEGWTPEEIKIVLDECMSGDYDNLLQVLMAHTEPEEDDLQF